jgi:hypothetical protein
VTLGASPALSLAAARAAAAEMYGKARLGLDPQQAKLDDRNAQTVGEVLQIYLARRRPQLSSRSIVEI